MFLFPFNFFPFRTNLLSVQKHWVRYYMVRQSYKIGSMLHVKLDLDVLIRFYISRFEFRWLTDRIYKDRAQPGRGRRWARASPLRLTLRARGARSRLACACSFCQKYMNSYMITAKNIWIHTWHEIIFVWILIFKVQKIYEFIHGAPQITYEDPILNH